MKKISALQGAAAIAAGLGLSLVIADEIRAVSSGNIVAKTPTSISVDVSMAANLTGNYNKIAIMAPAAKPANCPFFDTASHPYTISAGAGYYTITAQGTPSDVKKVVDSQCFIVPKP